MMQQLYDMVDDEDRFICLATKEEIIARGQWQRVVHIFLFGHDRKLLLCKRPHKPDKAYSGLWSSSAGGHVECGETYEQAARRELKEELKSEVQLHDQGRFDVVDAWGKKIHHLFEASYEGLSGDRLIGPECVESEWVGLAGVTADIAMNPQVYAESFKLALRYHLSLSTPL